MSAREGCERVPIGGQTIEKAGRPLGVHDYADSLRKMGYEVEVYKPAAGGDLTAIKTEFMKKDGIPITEKSFDIYRLPDDIVPKPRKLNFRNY